MRLSDLGWNALRGLVLAISVAVLGILFGCALVVQEPVPTLGVIGWIAVDLFIFLVIVWGSITFHELGHLLAAVSGRMRVLLVVLGPVKYVREGERFRFLVNWRFPTPGYVLASPPDAPDLRRRMILFAIAGPLANLLLGALLLGLAVHHNPQAAPPPTGTVLQARLPWMPQSLLVTWMAQATFLNLMLFVLNIIPGTYGKNEMRSDGALILGLLRRDTRTVRQLLLITLAATSRGGVRPRDWNRNLVERILAGGGGPVGDASANLYAYYQVLDCGELEEAGRCLDRVIGRKKFVLPELQSGLLLEAAYYAGFHRRNAAAARAALDQAIGGVVEPQTRLRAEAAVLLAEGRPAEAAAKAREGLAVVDTSADRGGAIAEREWLEAILAECERQLNPRASATPSEPQT